MEIVKAITAAGLKITPDVVVNGGGAGSDGGNNGLVQLLLANFVRQQTATMPGPAPKP